MSPSHTALHKLVVTQLLRPYKCSSCYKTFKKQNQLTRHIKIHSDERRHKCPYCGKAFLRSDNLKKHIRIHTGEKFPCPFCNRGFTDGSNLTKHIRTHTGEGRHRCKFCLKHFAGLSALQRHLQEHEEDMLFAMDTSLVKIERPDASEYLSYMEQNNGHLNEKESQRPVHPLLSESNQNSSSEEPYLDKTNSFNSNLLLVKTERTDDSDYLSYIEQNHGHFNMKELFQGSPRPTSPLLTKRNQNSSSEKPYLDKRNSFNSNLLPQMKYQEPVIPAVSMNIEKTVNPFESLIVNTNQDLPQWQCVLCLEEFSSRFPLLSHLKRHVANGVQIPDPWNHHNTAETEEVSPVEQLNCRYCQKSFTRQSELLAHTDLTLCKNCGKIFACSMLLEKHQDTCQINWMDKGASNESKDNYNKSSEVPVENYQASEAENQTLDTKDFPLLTAVKQEIIFSDTENAIPEPHLSTTKLPMAAADLDLSLNKAMLPILTSQASRPIKDNLIIFSDTENAIPDHHISTNKSLLAAVDSDLSLKKALSQTLTSPIKDDLMDCTQMLNDANILSSQQKTHSDSDQEILTETIFNNLKKSQVFDSGITASLDILPKPEPPEDKPISVNPQKPLTLLDSQLQNFGQDLPDSTKDFSFNTSIYEAYKCAKAALNDPNCFQEQNLHSSSNIQSSGLRCQNCGKNFQFVFEFREHLRFLEKFIGKFCPENSQKLETLKNSLNIHLLHSFSGHLERNLGRGDAQLELPDSENTQSQRLQSQSQRIQPQSQRIRPQSQQVQPQSQLFQPPTVLLNANNNPLLHTCNVCHKTFTQTSQLNRHRKIHFGIKNHKCTFCSKTFLRSDNLRKHLRIHLGIKQYACTICKKRFTDSSNLVKHQRIHNANRQGYFCNLCCRSFISYKGFCKHIQTHEPTVIEEQSAAVERFTDNDVGSASPTLIERQSIADECFPDNDVGSASPTLIDGQLTADEPFTDNDVGPASLIIPQKTSRVGAGVHTKNNLQIKILEANVCDKPTFESRSSETNQLKALKMKLARKLNSSINKNGNLPDTSFDSRNLSSLLKRSTEPNTCSSNSFEQNQISSRSAKLSLNPKYESFCPSPEEFSVYLKPHDVTAHSLEGDQLRTKRLGSLITCNGSDQTEETRLKKKEEWNHDVLQIFPLPKEQSVTSKSKSPEPSDSSSVNNIFTSLTEQIKDNLTLDMVVDDKRKYCSPMQNQLGSGILEQQQQSCTSEINTINIKSDQNFNASTTNFPSSFASCDSAKKEPVSENSDSDLTASNACFTQRATEDKLEMSAYYSMQTSLNDFVMPIAQESQLTEACRHLDKKLSNYSGIRGTFENSPNSADDNSALGNLAMYLSQLRDCSFLTKSG